MNLGLSLSPSTLATILSVANRGPVAAVLQNVAMRGKTHNGTIIRNGSKTRMKGITRFRIGYGGAKVLAPVFSNFWLNNVIGHEIAGPSYTLLKAAISFEGVTVPLFFDGARSFTFTAGQAVKVPTPLIPSQFSRADFPYGYVAFVRWMIDLPTAAIPAQIDPLYLGGESQLMFDPANTIDDIDGTTWGIPTGADQWVAAPHPIFLSGESITPMTSLLAIGDSIFNSASDLSGDGESGGGWPARMAFAESIPLLNITRTGDKAQFFAAANSKIMEVVRAARGDAALIGLGNNDIRDGRTQAQYNADIASLVTTLRANGVQWVGQTLIANETTSTDQNTSADGQTIVANFASRLPGINAGIVAKTNGIDDYIDTPSTYQSGGKFNVPMFETTLTEAVAAYAGSIKLAMAPEVGDLIAFEPNTPANADGTWQHVTAVSGTGPYTVTLVGGPEKAHAAGVIVRISNSRDGIHPQVQPHKLAAQKAASMARRIKGVRTPWIDLTKNVQIDFVNRRAQLAGQTTSIAALVSCTRPSVGRSFDGISWFEHLADELRYSDGGGLYVEPARTNSLANNAGVGSVSGSKPNIWSINLVTGISATYKLGMENGIEFVDIRLSGAPNQASVASLDFQASIPAVIGDMFNLSGYFALVAGSLTNISRIDLGIRGGASGGGASEFQNGGDIKSQFTRKMKRFDFNFTMGNAATTVLNYRLGVTGVTNQPVDLTIRCGLMQAEKGSGATSPIKTTGAAATRAADAITLNLPQQTNRLAVTFDNDSVQIIENAFGNFALPALNRTVIKSIASLDYAAITTKSGDTLTSSRGGSLDIGQAGGSAVSLASYMTDKTVPSRTQLAAAAVALLIS